MLSTRNSHIDCTLLVPPAEVVCRPGSVHLTTGSNA